MIHSKSDNMEIIINDKVDEVIKETPELFISRYQIDLETAIKGRNFIFDCGNSCRTKVMKYI